MQSHRGLQSHIVREIVGVCRSSDSYDRSFDHLIRGLPVLTRTALTAENCGKSKEYILNSTDTCLCNRPGLFSGLLPILPLQSIFCLNLRCPRLGAGRFSPGRSLLSLPILCVGASALAALVIIASCIRVEGSSVTLVIVLSIHVRLFPAPSIVTLSAWGMDPPINLGR